MGGDPLESATHPLDGGGGGGDDDTYWSTPDSILVHERELAEAKKDRIDECTMRLSSALVYSREHADRQRGIVMLEASLNNSGGGFPKESILYLLAVGYQRSEDYPMSMRYLDLCLEIKPNFGAALSLKKTIEEQRAREVHERELAEAKKLSALVHSREHADRQRGIAMLEASLNNSGGGFPKARILYLLAVGYQRSEDYPMSMRYLDLCLEIEPNFGEALSLQKTIEEQRAREIEPNCGEAPSLKKTIEEKFAQSSYNLSRFGDSWTGIGIAVGGVAAVGGIAAVYGTGVVGGMAAAVAVRRGLVVAATAGAILAAKKMAASPSGSSAMKN